MALGDRVIEKRYRIYREEAGMLVQPTRWWGGDIEPRFDDFPTPEDAERALLEDEDITGEYIILPYVWVRYTT